MGEEMSGVADKATSLEVTDALGRHGESVRVELTKEEPGSSQKVADGMVEITLPVNESVEIFCRKLRIDLEAMGFEPSDSVMGYDDDDDDDEEDPRPASGPRPRLS